MFPGDVLERGNDRVAEIVILLLVAYSNVKNTVCVRKGCDESFHNNRFSFIHCRF